MSFTFRKKTNKKSYEKLSLWQERLSKHKNAYERELSRMDEREALYAGTKKIRGVTGASAVKDATHVRNIVSELIESQVGSAIPQPKVTARRPEDEEKARLIEDMLRNELDRLPFEQLNDQQERTCPIQGGALFLVEWDHGAVSDHAVGELCVSDIHPKKLIPQDGVFSGIQDMDYFFLLLPQTKQVIKRKYGVDVEDEAESDPDVRGVRADTCDDLVTQCVAYYRDEDGHVGAFSWVGDTVVFDLPDLFSRRERICKKCEMPGDGKTCAFCGSEVFTERIVDEETLALDIVRSDGSVIPCESPVLDEWGLPMTAEEAGPDGRTVVSVVVQPTKIPYYKPKCFPVALRKNVSIFGKFLGDSDVDKIEDQQNSIKKLSTKINEKLLKGGSYVTFPVGVAIDKSDADLKMIRLRNPADKALIDVLNIQPNISGDMAYMQQVYEEARQIIGITDSFQGRRDNTATSGVAKQFSAAQAAGRLESKRVMKEACYADLFEIMFKMKLAFADESRPVVSTDNQGNPKYAAFNRYDFLEQDESGAYYWNDDFLFSCDTSSTLAANREAMWQEARLNYQSGAYGNPAAMETLAVFWTRMEKLHYPGAADMRTFFEQKMEEERAAQMKAQAAPAGMPPSGGFGPMGGAAPMDGGFGPMGDTEPGGEFGPMNGVPAVAGPAGAPAGGTMGGPAG